MTTKTKKPKRAPDGHYPLVAVIASDPTQVLGRPEDLMFKQVEREQIAGCLKALDLPNTPAYRERIRDAIAEPLRRWLAGVGRELIQRGLDAHVDDDKKRNDNAADEEERQAIARLFDELWEREKRISPDKRPNLAPLYAELMAQHVPKRGLTLVKEAIDVYSRCRPPKKKRAKS